MCCRSSTKFTLCHRCRRTVGFALAVADLEGEEAVGFQESVGLGDEAAVDVEAFGASEESGVGLVVADFGVEGGAVGLGDVGRVADDGVVGGFVCDGSQEVGLEEGDAVGYVVGFCVRLRDFQCFGGEVEGGDLGLWEMDG